MTKTVKIVGILAVVALGAAVISSFVPKYSACDQYVCTSCALERSEYKLSVGLFTFRDKVTLQDSALSRALKIKDCPHAWLRYRFAYDSGFLLGGWKFFADGGSRSSMLRLLLVDEGFAADLARMKDPSSVLKDMLVCLDRSRELDDLLGEWWTEPDRGNFSDWWQTNKQSVHSVLVGTNR